jgi:parallel beta-helix repeat protein
VQVDSVKYYSCGTGTVDDDSMLVYFDQAIDDDHSATAACSAFSVIGLGSIQNATLRTGSTVDDNILVIDMTGTDEVLSHDRTRLVLVPNAIRTLSGGSSVTDTTSVQTFNVYNKRLAATYQTIQQAIANAQSNDTIAITDAGFYSDTLSFSNAPLIVGIGAQRPVIKYNGSGMDNHDAWQGHDLMVYHSRWMQAGPVFRNICWDGVSANNDTASTFAFLGSGNVESCSLKSAYIYFHSAGVSVVKDCDISGKGFKWANGQSSSKVVHNLFHNITAPSGYGALLAYSAKNTRIERNEFRNNTGVALYLRAADNNTIANNLIHNNSGQAVFQYSTIDADLPVWNRYINNTICNNSGGGLELDSMCLVVNNIVYNNSSWDIKKNTKAQVSATMIKYNLADTTGSGLDGLISGVTNIVDTTNPLFVSSTDFHLQSSSPCVNFTDFNADSAQYYGVTVDLEGNTRPLPSGTNLDAGAFEQGGGSPKAVTQPLLVLAGGGEQQLIRGVQPNPFKMTTEISYRVISTDNFKVPTRVAVFDIYGNLVRRLVDECLPAGDYRAIWDGKNKAGKIVGNGIYYCKIQTGEKSESIRVMVIR